METGQKRKKQRHYDMRMHDMIFFACDGGKECGKHPGCYRQGGDCWHTADIEHALNFKKTKDGAYIEKGLIVTDADGNTQRDD